MAKRIDLTCNKQFLHIDELSTKRFRLVKELASNEVICDNERFVKVLHDLNIIEDAYCKALEKWDKTGGKDE